MKTIYILGWYTCFLQQNGKGPREIYPVIAITKKFIASSSADTVAMLTSEEWEIFRTALETYNAHAQFTIR